MSETAGTARPGRSAQAELTEVAEALLMAVARRGPHREERDRLLAHLRDVVLPQVDADTERVQRARHAHGAACVGAVTNERRMLHVLAEELEATGDPIEAAALAGAIVVLCENRFQQDTLLEHAVAEGVGHSHLVGALS